jgi:hypothetical protein
MLTRTYRFFASLIFFGLLLTTANTGFAKEISEPAEPSRQIDVVIALDVSGSMSGLIASAKQRLWDIVNQLGRAQPQPELRIAVMSFGNPEYGQDKGYVRIDLPFTSDLDAVNRTLFGFTTNGGDEYVARAVSTAATELAWSTGQDALRILFVAGNEAATQDPQVSVQQAAQLVNAQGIVVNTIFCGAENDSDSAGWRDVAAMTNGLYASIDQNSAAVANIATPLDQKLTTLNQALNETYLPYGDTGDDYRANQLEQDKNAGAMSPTAIASRVVTKAGRLYDNSRWDLVDALESGQQLEEIAVEDLPDSMKDMDEVERKEYVERKAEKRDAIQAEIQTLERERQEFIADKRKKLAKPAQEGLDVAIQNGLKALAEEKGFTFGEE